MNLRPNSVFQAALILFFPLSAMGQGNGIAAPVGAVPAQTQGTIQETEQMRLRCIEARRIICGKIVRVRADGIVVESGYTNLLRKPLTKSWLVPGTVVASPARNLIEGKEPGAICIGQVFLTDLPRGKPRPGDYVIICGYPTGEITYQSVGMIRKTARRFSARLDAALNTNLAAVGPSKPQPTAAPR